MDLRERLENDLNTFRQLRDEVRVQAELGSADLRDRMAVNRHKARAE